MRLIIVYLTLFCFLEAGVSNFNIIPSGYDTTSMGITILDQKRLSFDTIEGQKFSELSDVTYHQLTNTLYFVGDKGFLYAFNAKFSNQIETLHPQGSVSLKNKNGKRLKKWRRDSEGLTLDGKGRLLISFEGEAKVAWFHKNSDAYGNRIRHYAIPKVLTNTKNYRSKNKSLESLAWHPRYGTIIATEWPIKKYHKKKHTIYGLSGKRWHFRAEPEARSGMAAMEVMDDGNILVLERSYIELMKPLVVTLKKVYLDQCKSGICKSKVLAKMNTHQGWDIDNFEGLARVGENRYVMVSDDNNNFFQRTLLIYFEVNDE